MSILDDSQREVARQDALAAKLDEFESRGPINGSGGKIPEIVIEPGKVPSFCRELAKAFADGNAPIYRRSTMLMRATRVDTADAIGGEGVRKLVEDLKI